MDDVGNEDALIDDARAGSARAFGELVRRYTPAVYGVAVRLSETTSDAEEVVQDTFLRAYRHLPAFRREAKFSTWLFRIAVNSARMHRRRERRHVAERLDDERSESAAVAGSAASEDAAPGADERLASTQLAGVALQALAALPARYRLPFVLRHIQGLDTDETARILDIRVDLVRQRVRRARLALRRYLRRQVGAGCR